MKEADLHVVTSEEQYLEPENYDSDYDCWNNPASYEPEDDEFVYPWELGYKTWIYGNEKFNNKNIKRV